MQSIRGMKGPGSDGTPPHVLIVEDEAKTRAAIAEALRMEGWNVTEAARGREMIVELEQRTFDLVILDWMLPGRDGLELLQHVRARGKRP
jgi:two-component system, OmpR family, response regulator